jgi:lipopolysaccharide transport protein LptA
MSAENSSRSPGWPTALVFTVLLCGTATTAYAQIGDLRLPISLDADSTDYDGKSSMLRFEGLRLSQGNMGVVADEGRASKLDFEDSVWRFDGNVVIDTENGRIECDSADLTFTEHELRLAIIEGDKATFEMVRPGSTEVTYAEARKLRYDLLTATVEFSGEAIITEGGNEIESELLVYDILERRIKAASSGETEDKVRIRYTPPPSDEDTEGDVEDEEADSEVDDEGVDENP